MPMDKMVHGNLPPAPSCNRASQRGSSTLVPLPGMSWCGLIEPSPGSGSLRPARVEGWRSRRHHGARPHRWQRRVPRIDDQVVDVDVEVRRHDTMIPHVGLPSLLHQRRLAPSRPFLAPLIAPILCSAVTWVATGGRPPRFALRLRPLSLARPPPEGGAGARAGLRPRRAVHAEGVAAVRPPAVHVVHARLAARGRLSGGQAESRRQPR